MGTTRPSSVIPVVGHKAAVAIVLPRIDDAVSYHLFDLYEQPRSMVDCNTALIKVKEETMIVSKKLCSEQNLI